MRRPCRLNQSGQFQTKKVDPVTQAASVQLADRALAVVRVDGRMAAMSNKAAPIHSANLKNVIGPWKLVKNGATERYSPQRAAIRYTNRGEMSNTVGQDSCFLVLLLTRTSGPPPRCDLGREKSIGG